MSNTKTMITVDMHCDTISKCQNIRENTGHLDLMKMQKGHYLLQNFALFVEMRSCSDPWERVCELKDCFCEEMKKNEDLISQVLSYDDIEKNRNNGKMSALLTVEEGGVCKGEIEKLRELYSYGVRMLTITWNYKNELGSPNYSNYGDFSSADEHYKIRHTPNTEDGLTEKGKEFVIEMENLGIIPDVSHLSDAGFYDVANTTKKPFVASHSNAREVCTNVRNMTDNMIRTLAEKGGVMGLNYCPNFLEEGPGTEPCPGTISAIVRHARHIVNVGGIDVLGLGSDFDGIDDHKELRGAQDMEKLWDALIKDGFSEADTDKIFGENVLRVYRDTL